MNIRGFTAKKVGTMPGTLITETPSLTQQVKADLVRYDPDHIETRSIEIDEISSSLSDKLVGSASPNLRNSIATIQNGLNEADERMRKLISLVVEKEGG